jgi:hypothetical protein
VALKLVHKHYLFLLVLFAAIWIYYPTLGMPLHGDDYFAFIDISSKPFPKFMSDVLQFKDSNVAWRPLAQAYYYAMYQLFGLSGMAFHAGNLAVFLVTLAALYALCLQWGFGRTTGATAAAIFTLFPSHVVTVAWTTTAGRIFDVCFLLLALLVLVTAIRRKSWKLEVLAQLLLVLSYLADETAVVYCGVFFCAALVFDRSDGWPKRSALRALPTAIPAIAVAAAEFLVGTRNDTTDPHLGLSIFEHFWALTGRLVYVSQSILITDAPSGQWIAGAVVLAAIASILVLGSPRLKLIAAWVLAALLPFAITLPITPARYVYPAALPFAILVSVAAAAVARRAASIALPEGLIKWAPAAYGPALAGTVLALAALLGPATVRKDDAFNADAAQYEWLAEQLRAVLPNVAPGTTLVIYYGTWNEPFGFASAVAETVYHDKSIRLVSVPRGQVTEGRPAYPNERRLYKVRNRLVLAPQKVLQAR